MVSAFTLDTISFTILGVSVGLQNFMDSKAPVLSFQLPRDADYVEVLRCPSNAVIMSSTNAISMAKLPSIIASQSDLLSFYQQNDIFNGAAQTSSCMLVADALNRNSFVDSIAPSGNLVYLLRACVNPVRLTDAEKLSSRNCSLVVAVSPNLNGFVNSQQEDIQENLRMAASYSGKKDAVALRMQYIAAQANAALDKCEKEGHGAQVDKIVRDSWTNLGAAIAETTLDVLDAHFDQLKNGITDWGEQLKAQFLPFSKVNGVAKEWGQNASSTQQALMLLGDIQGYMLTDTLTKITAQSRDFARSCAAYQDLITQMQVAQVDLAAAVLGYAYYRMMAQLAHRGPASGGSGGISTESGK
jgi:hypothetical protein